MDMNYYKLMKSGVHVKSKTMSINLPLNIRIHKKLECQSSAVHCHSQDSLFDFNDKSVLVKDGVLSL